MNKNILKERNLILHFIERATAEEEIVNKAEETKKLLLKELDRLTKNLGYKEYCDVYDYLITFETLVKEKYFNFGMLANDVMEYYEEGYEAEKCL